MRSLLLSLQYHSTLLICDNHLLAAFCIFNLLNWVLKKKKKTACNAGDPGLIPGLGRSSGEGTGNHLQYSCLENSMDRGAWWTTVPGIAKSQPPPNDTHTHTSWVPKHYHLTSRSLTLIYYVHVYFYMLSFAY